MTRATISITAISGQNSYPPVFLLFWLFHLEQSHSCRTIWWNCIDQFWFRYHKGSQMHSLRKDHLHAQDILKMKTLLEFPAGSDWQLLTDFNSTVMFSTISKEVSLLWYWFLFVFRSDFFNQFFEQICTRKCLDWAVVDMLTFWASPFFPIPFYANQTSLTVIVSTKSCSYRRLKQFWNGFYMILFFVINWTK